MSSVNPDELKALVLAHIKDADVEVTCYSGDDHFEMTVVSAAFVGKPRIVRHKMVYAALGDNMRQAVHALALKTKTPEEAAA
ncbi:MAG: BolA family protein [Ghiorsea sp.]|nr:BolA family protein [Ghiorsea sp.]